MFVKSLVYIISCLIIFAFSKSLYKNFIYEVNEFKGAQDVLGKTCSAIIPIKDDRVGYAEVASKKGAPLKIMVKSRDGQPISKKEVALVLYYDHETNIYTIETFDY